ncbi:MAG TPA: glycosyltransferase [Planctomycetota bacterium]
MDASSAPAVSFVIPAYDEELLLPRTLAALRATASALGLAHEIVVADDASNDRTAAVAAEGGARVVRVEHRQISATRNSGARAAAGDLLVFVDADTIVPLGPLAGALAVIAAGGVAGGATCVFDGTIPRWARLVLPPMLTLYRWARLTPGAFLFCTREAFEAVGGFDEQVFGGEEVLMARALDRFARRRGQRFTIVRSPVVTSARKLRAYRAGELLGTIARAALGGRRAARSRAGFELWYGPRRADPAGVPAAPPLAKLGE